MIEQIAKNACFGGQQLRFKHYAESLKCDMHFSLYLPPQVNSGDKKKVPLLTFLSGLTCSDENVVQKSGFQRYAAEYGIAVLAPDTSPRGEHIADDEHWDLGQGAGFYLNAIQAPWIEHYQMYTYITEELPVLLSANFPQLDLTRQAITGHSMGGHGAITIGLKNSQNFQSISAFAPISAPMQCPWGEKAFTAYLGDDKSRWKDYDSCELIKQAETKRPIKIDQGGEDNFLEEQLKPNLLLNTAADCNYPVEYELHPDYDHSYFFIASVIGEHFAFHAKHLGISKP